MPCCLADIVDFSLRLDKDVAKPQKTQLPVNRTQAWQELDFQSEIHSGLAIFLAQHFPPACMIQQKLPVAAVTA